MPGRCAFQYSLPILLLILIFLCVCMNEQGAAHYLLIADESQCVYFHNGPQRSFCIQAPARVNVMCVGHFKTTAQLASTQQPSPKPVRVKKQRKQTEEEGEDNYDEEEGAKVWKFLKAQNLENMFY